MTGATLFSGIGAPECAAPWIDWRFAAEIEHFPSAVLKARFPHVPNLGDVTASDFIERARAACAGAALDVLVFGSPCQDFSIAGKRLGIDAPRGNLAILALGIVRSLRPRWFIFENVPGLLSNWSSYTDGAGHGDDGGGGGRSFERRDTSDFASFLQGVEECGYSACWASPDAQWFGVAQRRERVFLVGHCRDWRGPAGVLSEFHRVPWDPPSRGESGQVGGVAGTLPARTRGGGGLGTDAELDGGLVPVLSHALSTCGRMDGESETFIAHTLRGEGMDASEDGTGRGTPIIAQTVTAEMYRSGGATAGNNGEPRNVIAVPILEAGARTGSSSTDPRAGMGIGTEGDPMFTVQSGKQHALAINMRGRKGGAMPEPAEVASVRAASGGSSRSLVASTRLRRLTALETERLQGFPDHWTAIDYRRRRISAAMARYLTGHGLACEFAIDGWRTRVANDTVRYRAIGNSMAVPVLAYLLKRIREVDRLMGGKR